MNKITKEEIMNLVNKNYDLITKFYGNQRILGIFVYGDANYGTLASIDDIKMAAYYLPTFEELCIKDNFLDIELGETRIIDFRSLYSKIIKKEDRTSSEALYTNFYKVNPMYEYIYENHLKKYRDQIIDSNRNLRIYMAANDAAAALEEDDLYNAYRLLTCCELHMQGKSYSYCLCPKQEVERYNIITKLKFDREYFSEKAYKELKDTTKERIEEIKKDIPVCPTEFIFTDKIKFGIMEIIRASIDTNSAAVDLKAKLTTTEKEALKYILNATGGDGYVSVSNLVTISHMSRPVFTSTLDKMEKTGAAAIKKQGVKGTYVQVLDAGIYSITF